MTCFVSHATSYKTRDNLRASKSLESRQSSTQEFYFIDVFSVNQNDVMGEDEIKALESVIESAKAFVLIFSP